MMKINHAKIFSIILLTLLTSCAAKQHILPLEYNPEQTLHCDRVTRQVSITVQDNRSNVHDPHLIGEATLGLMNQPVPAISKTPLDEFFTTALKSNLKKVGVNIVDSSTESDTQLSATITKFWVHEYAPGTTFEYAEADIEIEVYLTEQFTQKTIWAKKLQSNTRTDQNLLDATSQLDNVANDAIKHIVNRLAGEPGFCETLRSSFKMKEKQKQINQQNLPSPPAINGDLDELVLD